MPLVSVNGQMTPFVSALDRGLSFGDGVFETCLVRAGNIPLWPFHRERLIRGCERLFISVNVVDVERWNRALLGAAGTSEQPKVLKVIVTRGEGGRGYGFTTDEQPTVICSLHDGPAQSSGAQALMVCKQTMSQSTMLAGIKHLNRLENVLLKAECQRAGYDDAVVCDSDGHVIETTHSNIFFGSGEQLYTPRLDRTGVEGVMRRMIIEELAPTLGVDVSIECISLKRLPMFDAAFSCNGIRGISEIRSIGDSEFSSSVLFSRLSTALSSSRYSL